MSTDIVSIKEFAINQTQASGGNISLEVEKTTSEIIDEFHLVPCVFDRDSLFTIVIVEPSKYDELSQITNVTYLE